MKKTIAGPAVGSQGRVVIEVNCDDGVTRPDFIIPAGAPAGTTSKTYEPIAVGTKCTVTETTNGSAVGTEVVVTGDGQETTIPSAKHETVEVTDTYHHVGSLLVRKTIAGPGAGRQGEIRIHTVCDGTALTPDFVIPAGTPAGDQTKQYDHIDVPAKCTVTETADGHTSTVSAVVDGSGQTVSVAAGDIAEADISDSYGLLPGQLEVTKTITGPLAGQQGTVVIHPVCNGTPLTPDFVIPAGAPAGDQSHIYSNVPTPASCVVTETINGGTSAVSSAVIGSPHTAVIPPGGSGAAHITDTYGPAPRLAAGDQNHRRAVAPAFRGRSRSTWLATAPRCRRPLGSPRGPQRAASRTASTASPLARCAPSPKPRTAPPPRSPRPSPGNGQKVTVPAGKVAPVNLIDVYRGAPGSLKVTKTIAGRGGRLHGPIAILVDCGGPLHAYAFHIRAHVTGSKSRYFNRLPAGSRCTVTETANGHTGSVGVGVKGERETAIVRANSTARAHLVDTFTPRRHPGPIGLG